MPKIDLTNYPVCDEHEAYYKLLVAVNSIIGTVAAPELENENDRRTRSGRVCFHESQNKQTKHGDRQ